MQGPHHSPLPQARSHHLHKTPPPVPISTITSSIASTPVPNHRPIRTPPNPSKPNSNFHHPYIFSKKRQNPLRHPSVIISEAPPLSETNASFTQDRFENSQQPRLHKSKPIVEATSVTLSTSQTLPIFGCLCCPVVCVAPNRILGVVIVEEIQAPESQPSDFE